MKIKEVEIKGMNNIGSKKYELSNITYFHGPNGVGKSTILKAIQLCLLGYIPDEGKSKSSIIKHCNGSQMSITITFDNNEYITRTFGQVGREVVSNFETSSGLPNMDSIIGNSSLPIFNFNDFLSLTSNKMKEWFLNFLPNTEMELNWKQMLYNIVSATGHIDEEVKAEINNYVTTIKSYNLSGLAEVKKANEMFKQEQSLEKKEVERLSNTLQTFTLDMDIPLGEFNEDEINAKIKEYREKEINQSLQKDIIDNNKKAKEHLNSEEYIDLEDTIENDERYAEAVNSQKTLQEKLKQLKGTKAEYSTKKDPNKELIKANIEIESLRQSVSQSDICPILHTSCTELNKHKQNIQTELNSRIEAFESLKKEVDTYNEKKNNLELAITTCESELNDATSIVNDLTSRYNSRNTYKTLLRDPGEIDNTDYNSLINEALEDLKKFHNAQNAEKNYKSISNQVVKEKEKLERIKNFVTLTSTNGLQTEVTKVNNPFDLLVTEMSKTLNKWMGGTPYFNVEVKANSFEFGIDRITHRVAYNSLSTGEKCMFALSLLIALQTLSNSKLNLIMMDDAFDHLDSHNIENVFSVLKTNKDMQFIFAGVKDTQEGKENTIELTR